MLNRRSIDGNRVVVFTLALLLAQAGSSGTSHAGDKGWTDEFVFGEWAIQRRVKNDDGEYQLVQGTKRRSKGPGFEDCLKEFERVRQEKMLEPLKGKAIILVHGFIQDRKSLKKLGKYMAMNSDYMVMQFAYSSTYTKLDVPARSLDKVVRHLDGLEEINFIGFSLGNLVIRHYLKDQQGHRSGPPIGRIVMIAPPNHGAQFARKYADSSIANWYGGPVVKQIGVNFESELEPRLATPICEFGIIAGQKGTDRGYKPKSLTGDDDSVLTVKTTRLKGATDYRLLHAKHSKLYKHKDVFEWTLRFLREGCFVAPDQRQPIAAALRKAG